MRRGEESALVTVVPSRGLLGEVSLQFFVSITAAAVDLETWPVSKTFRSGSWTTVCRFTWETTGEEHGLAGAGPAEERSEALRYLPAEEALRVARRGE